MHPDPLVERPLLSMAPPRISTDVQSEAALESAVSTSPKNEIDVRRRSVSISSQQQVTPMKIGSPLRALLAIPFSPISTTPIEGTFRCSICWESTRNRDEVVNPCQCKSGTLKYVRLKRVSSLKLKLEFVGASHLYQQMGQ